MRIDSLNTNNESQKSINSFYISFSDLMVILCVFFVMIISMSKVETGHFEKIKSAFTGQTKDTLMELAIRLKEIATTDPGVPGVTANMASDGVRLDMDTSMLFDLGSAVLKTDSLAPLAPLLTEINKTGYLIDVEGHTDDLYMYKKSGDEIETNWSLSGRRASSVVHFLLEFGISPRRRRIVGHADTRPKVEIENKTGQELIEARAQNRRVTLLIR